MDKHHNQPEPGCRYAELRCLSNFSFLRGASHPEELVASAAALGYTALAITDECSVSGVVRAHAAAKPLPLKLIIGAQFHLQDGFDVILLAQNREGYAQLSSLITTARRRAPKGHYALYGSDLDDALPDCLLLVSLRTCNQEEAGQLAELQQRFTDRLWLTVERHYLAGEALRIDRIRQLGQSLDIPLVACGDVHMHRRSRRALQDVLTSIRLKIPIREAGHALYSNGERYLRPLTVLQSLYEPTWLQETVVIASHCHFSLDELRYEYPAELVPEGESADSHLRKLTAKGLREHWPEGAPIRVLRQIIHELHLIAELHYAHYFLTVHDIVHFARSQNILCQGRGSAANSAVCYCLGITAVDPARVNMLFERFISKERNEPPDIDVDFENSRRETVMQYIYRKYGRHRAALTATLITYRRKSALRDVGKALGLTQDQIERLIGTLAWWDHGIPEERLQEAGFSADTPVIKQLLFLVQELIGFPRHLSQHVGGFLIAQDNLSRLVPVENATMQDRTVIQWDKNDLDTLGLLKIDCLALGMLSAIHRSFDLLRQHCNLDYQLADIPAEDAAVYRMMQRADTVGVFQIESRAQMNMLPRLKPACYYDLVIQIAIVRPGPIQGDMVHPYLRRRRGEEHADYPSPAVRKVLERTLGIPIFQEQVIELAMVAAGFSGGEADQLRRAIGSWRSQSQLELFRHKLLEGMMTRGYSRAFAEQIFNQIKGFGEYGFPESHSASFALIAYVSAWLKHYHPAVFTCALLNSLPMGFYGAAQLIQDAKRHHVEIRPIDINHSRWESSLEAGQTRKLALRLGLHRVKHLNRKTAERILAARQQAPFTSVQDLFRRSEPGQRDLNALASADALKGLAGHRHQARWETLGCEIQPGLFADMAITEPLPDLPVPTKGDDIVADYDSIGLSLRRHPLALLRARFERYRWLSIRAVQNKRHGSHIRMAGLVNNRQHPSSAKGTIFLTLEDETGNINIIVWAHCSQRYRREVLQGRLLMVSGKVEREGRVVHVVADALQDYTGWLGALETRSRDFH